MGLEDLLHQKEIKEYTPIAEYYQDLANRYNIIPLQNYDSFAVIADEELAQAAMSNCPSPISGIKIHSPLSVEMYNVLKSDEFKEMLKK